MSKYCPECGRPNQVNTTTTTTGTTGITWRIAPPPPSAAKPEWVQEMFDRLIKLEDALDEGGLDD